MKKHRIGALIAAGALTLTFAGTALGAVVYATVDGHAPHSSDNNHEDTWGKDCVKIDDLSLDYWDTDWDYGLVVVKGASGDYANTIFINVAKGERVWADSNGNNQYDVGGPGGDAQISHIIVCEPGEETETTETETTSTETSTETTSTETSTETTSTEITTSTIDTETTETTDSVESTTETTDSVESTTETTESVESETESKTPPATDALAGGDATVSGSLWALLVGAAGILAGVLLLTPKSIRNRR